MRILLSLFLVWSCGITVPAQDPKPAPPDSITDPITTLKKRLKSGTTPEDTATLLTLCAAVADGGKNQTSNPNGKKMFGGLYTNFLRVALAYAPIDFVNASLQREVTNHKQLIAQLSSATDLENYITEVFEFGTQFIESHKAEIKKNLNEIKLPGKSDAITKAGSTTPLEVLAALGKPLREDYNPDGKFVYAFDTKTGFDVFLFDQENRLIRNRTYSDALKSK